MEKQKRHKVQLTPRGKAVAKQKKDLSKKWYEIYFSPEYYEKLIIKEILKNTDSNTSMYTYVFKLSTLKNDRSIRQSISQRISNARKKCEVEITGLIL